MRQQQKVLFLLNGVYFQKNNIYYIMLGSGLNSMKQSETSKSSILPEEMDQKKLKDLLDEKDRTIRKLTKKIDKLEDTLKRTIGDKQLKGKNIDVTANQNMHLQLLKAEIDKSKKLEEIIDEITERVNLILEDLSHDNTLTENSQQIREMLQMMEVSRNISLDQDFQSQMERTLNISSQWTKRIDILQGAFKTFKSKFTAISSENKTLASDNEALRRKVELLLLKIQDNEQLKQLNYELKQEKKQKEKMKKLLQKTQYQKNELTNKINAIGLKDAQFKAKTKEELMQYSKELSYRIKDLETEKASILKQSTKDKQQDLKKYQDFLKKLKVMKQKSILGKSVA